MSPIEKYLEIIETEVNDGRKALLGDGVIVNGEAILQAVQRIRMEMPEIIKEAQQVVAKANQIRSDSMMQARAILEDAQSKANAMVSNNEIHNVAMGEAEAIRQQAIDYQNKIQASVKKDVDTLLTGVEESLRSALVAIEHGKELNK